MSDKIQKIRETLAAGDTAKASKMLKWLLQNDPSADAWVLAAEMASDNELKIKFLRKALTLDEWHAQANRMLHKLEDVKPLSQMAVPASSEWSKTTGMKPVSEIKRQLKQDKHREHSQRQQFYGRMGCLFSIFLMFFISTFALRAIGLISSSLTAGFNALFGLPTPIVAYEGTPLAELENVPLLLTPSHSEVATDRDMEILDNGYMNEHTFEARSGEEVLVYIQFLSVNANRVSRNVAILDPDGNDARGQCFTDTILKGDNNVTFTCLIQRSGTYRVRVLGRDGESVGAYFVGVESLDAF